MKRYLADLHIHTTCSDGWVKPEKISSLAKKKGLDIVAVADHNSIEGGIRAKQASGKDHAFVIPGIEVSVRGGDHVLGFFVEQMINSRKLEEVIEEIRGQGGIAVWAHPVHYPILAKLRRRQPRMPKKDELYLFDAIEVYIRWTPDGGGLSASGSSRSADGRLHRGYGHGLPGFPTSRRDRSGELGGGEEGDDHRCERSFSLRVPHAGYVLPHL